MDWANNISAPAEEPVEDQTVPELLAPAPRHIWPSLNADRDAGPISAFIFFTAMAGVFCVGVPWAHPIPWSLGRLEAVAILLLFAGYIARLYWRSAQLVHEGVSVQGRVTGKPVRGKGIERKTYMLDFEFQCQGEDDSEPRVSRQVVRKLEWDTVIVGDTLIVLYLPQNPKRNGLYRFLPFCAVR